MSMSTPASQEMCQEAVDAIYSLTDRRHTDYHYQLGDQTYAVHSHHGYFRLDVDPLSDLPAAVDAHVFTKAQPQKMHRSDLKPELPWPNHLFYAKARHIGNVSMHMAKDWSNHHWTVFEDDETGLHITHLGSPGDYARSAAYDIQHGRAVALGNLTVTKLLNTPRHIPYTIMPRWQRIIASNRRVRLTDQGVEHMLDHIQLVKSLPRKLQTPIQPTTR